MIKKLYVVGDHNFLTDHGIVGKWETFYARHMFLYKKIARTTFNEHHIGIEIFTIQGFK